MSNKHTPGPWRVSDQCATIIKRDFRMIGSNEGELIANTAGHPNSGFFPSDEEAIANARLIAAAPDLLEALQHIMRCIPIGGFVQIHHGSSTWRQISDAIGKAAGDAP